MVKKEILEHLLKSEKIVAVGTTSVRTLESLYWLGIKTMQQPSIAITDLTIQQWDPYQENLAAINLIISEYDELLISIEAINSYYEKNIPPFFDELEMVKATIKKSNDNKLSKKAKDNLFDEASGTLKDSMQGLLELYSDGNVSE